MTGSIKKVVERFPVLQKAGRKLRQLFPLETSNKKNIKGKGNKLDIESSAVFRNCQFQITGDNNVIAIKAGCFFNKVTFHIDGSNNEILIAENVKFVKGGELWVEDTNCTIRIGEDTTFEDVHIAVTEPGSNIIIGRDCMFANDIDVRTGDSHSIINATTGQRINYAKDVQIGNHVWVASHVSILKGVTIAANSVVATRSVVTGAFDKEGILIGGAPAKELKDNITWDRRRI